MVTTTKHEAKLREQKVKTNDSELSAAKVFYFLGKIQEDFLSAVKLLNSCCFFLLGNFSSDNPLLVSSSSSWQTWPIKNLKRVRYRDSDEPITAVITEAPPTNSQVTKSQTCCSVESKHKWITTAANRHKGQHGRGL